MVVRVQWAAAVIALALLTVLVLLVWPSKRAKSDVADEPGSDDDDRAERGGREAAVDASPPEPDDD